MHEAVGFAILAVHNTWACMPTNTNRLHHCSGVRTKKKRDTVNVADPTSQTWRTKFPASYSVVWMPQSVGSQLFYESTLSKHVVAYNSNGPWDPLLRMKEVHGCSFGICAKCDGIAAVGGMGSEQALCNVECFSFGEKGWERLPNMGRARGALGVAMWQDKLIVVGGDGKDGKLNCVEAYDRDRGAWQVMPPQVHAEWLRGSCVCRQAHCI